MNTQKPIKKSKVNGSLVVHSMFRTIQGEGPFTGIKATFIRLYGCNLQCPFCDTNYTSTHYQMTADQIMDSLYELHQDELCKKNRKISFGELIVITGGEPFRQDISELVHKLLYRGYKVQIETNGTLFNNAIPYTHKRLHIVCSPKTSSINKKLIPHINTFKYVLSADSVDENDGLPILALNNKTNGRVYRPFGDELYKKPVKSSDIWVGPMDVQNKVETIANVKCCINSVLKYGYRLNLQIHKLVGLE